MEQDTDNLALVLRLSGALEKAQPGAKRILFGMVAETLALARKASRPLKIVMVDDDPGILGVYVDWVRGWFSGIEVVAFDKPLEALEALEALAHHDPNLLITGDRMPRMGGEELVQKLVARNINYPVLVLTANSQAQQWVNEYARRAINVRYHKKPGSDDESEQLRNVIETILQIPRSSTEKAATVAQQPRPILPLRIVQVNDEPYVLDAFDMMLRHWWPDANILSFGNGAAALEELLRTEPDLLITDDRMPGMTGFDLCERLLYMQVKYPIIYYYGLVIAEMDRWLASLISQGLNLTPLTMPCDFESLRIALEATGLKIPGKESGPAEIPSKSSKTGHPRVVVVYNEEGPRASIEAILRGSFYNLELLLFEDSREACEALTGATASRTTPDLLITNDRMPGMSGEGLVRHLAKRGVTYPIIVMSAWNGSEQWVLEYSKQGLNIKFLSLPFDVAEFLKASASSLNIPVPNWEKSESPHVPTESRVEVTSQSPKSRPPRIIILDDEEGPRASYSVIFKSWYDGAEILQFADADEAWLELSREDPDLFITDIRHRGMTCKQMMASLSRRKAPYSILVISAGISLHGGGDFVLGKQNVRAWGPNLKISCLSKPMSIEDFRTVVEAALQIPSSRTP